MSGEVNAIGVYMPIVHSEIENPTITADQRFLKWNSHWSASVCVWTTASVEGENISQNMILFTQADFRLYFHKILFSLILFVYFVTSWYLQEKVKMADPGDSLEGFRGKSWDFWARNCGLNSLSCAWLFKEYYALWILKYFGVYLTYFQIIWATRVVHSLGG